MVELSKHNKKLLRTLAYPAAVVALALLCRRLVLETDHPFWDRLLHFSRTMLYLGLFSAWGVTVHRRIIQLQARHNLVAVSICMVLWLTMREYRWHLVLLPDAVRLLWYSYYIPLLLILLLCFFISLSLDKGETYRLPKYTRLLFLPVAVLIALVLTNDVHQWIFVFPEDGFLQTELNYRYGAGYYVLTGWCVLCAAASFVTLLIKCRVPKTGKYLWQPILPFLAAMIYILLYALRVPFVVNALGDMTVCLCLMFTAFFESCIQCGLIPSNTRYLDLFLASEDLSVQITDNDYTVRYAARGIAPVTREDMLRAEGAPVVLSDGRLLHNMPVHGGHAIWTEDISELISRRESLAETREELQDRDGILQMEYEQEKKAQQVREQNRLYDLLQKQTRTQLAAVAYLTEIYASVEDPEKKRHILTRITVLGSYIKRRKDFVLRAEDAPEVTESRLNGALEETFHALVRGGIRSAYRIETGERPMDGRALTLAYDFIEDVIEAAMDGAKYLFVHVGQVGAGVRCSVLADCAVDCALLSRKYPAMHSSSDEDGGTECILPLSGAETE